MAEPLRPEAEAAIPQRGGSGRVAVLLRLEARGVRYDGQQAPAGTKPAV